ncbi:Y-family DNA polymerase [Methylobrevis pamukkalensis]|uniref:DNA-directed DNA polymerase n=1 Tax=Methylobrevis pamukkalensis TaxID=1439726 RepID=A0A1E3H596_9HYPH|nr:type VI secretion protein ImpB [Methylobrevis pamukkalensis]ODN71480.1 DNA polymerase IV [Methylobrevis pamukkalensis]
MFSFCSHDQREIHARPDRIERLYIDFDSFYASAEQHLDPALVGRPVGVIPIESRSTSLIAASREAKRFGVKTHTPLREALRLLPDLVVRVARPDVYVRLHHEIRAVVDSVVPILAVRSIDEMVCALLENEAARGADLARAVKDGLRRAFGPALTASIGLAANERLAKIAAEMEKPDGFVRLDPDTLPGRLLDVPLGDIPGIGERMATRLARAGVTDMPALWALAPKQMRALWGSVEGERLWYELHGYEVIREATETGMFSHGRVLAGDWRTPERQRDCARLLLGKAARRMRRAGFSARRLTLSIKGETGGRWHGEAPLPDARDDFTLLHALDGLFARAARQTAPARARGVAVSLSDLVASDTREAGLFPGADDAARGRRERLADVVDALHARHGRTSSPSASNRRCPAATPAARSPSDGSRT